MLKHNKTKKQKRKNTVVRIKSKKTITKRYKYNRYKKVGGQYTVIEDVDPPAYKESYDELINK